MYQSNRPKSPPDPLSEAQRYADEAAFRLANSESTDPLTPALVALAFAAVAALTRTAPADDRLDVAFLRCCCNAHALPDGRGREVLGWRHSLDRCGLIGVDA